MAVTDGIVRRRRALRAAQDPNGNPVLNADGTPKQLFDFDLRVEGPKARTRMVTVFMTNRIACACALIKPGDRVIVEGAGAKIAPAPNDDGIDAHVTLRGPCTVKVFAALPLARGDASTQIAHSEVASVHEFSKEAVPVKQSKRSTPGGVARALPVPGSSQTTKRRRHEPSSSKYTYTALGDLKSGVANFFGVVVGGTFPKKTSNDHLATYDDGTLICACTCTEEHSALLPVAVVASLVAVVVVVDGLRWVTSLIYLFIFSSFLRYQLVDESTWRADQRDPTIFTVSVFCPTYNGASCC